MEIKLNLASKVYLNRQSVRLWLMIGCTFLVLFLVWNLISGYRSYNRLQVLDTRFAELDLQVANVEGVPAGFTKERYAAVKNEINVANNIVAADRFRWTEMLSRFEELVPKDVSIRTIQPNYEDRSLRLGAVARDVTAMNTFMDNLLSSERFNQAFLQQHSTLDADQGDLNVQHTGFSLVIKEAF